MITITAKQLREVLEAFSPDELEEEEGSEITIGQLDRRVIDGETLPAGLYAWLADYPEDGAIHLG